jgi:predicted dehydrogenase
MDEVQIVGVSDPDPETARQLGEDMGCGWASDFRELCTKVKPDFVFALGRHCDMAEEAAFLLDQGIHFAIEKPCGLNAYEVRKIASQAARKGAFVAVPFVWRHSELLDVVRQRSNDESLRFVSFRFIAGPPMRYVAAGCPWMLDPALSGGGSTITLSVHFFDLFRVLTARAEAEVAFALMSNSTWGLPIEDYSVVGLRSGASLCIAETGYGYSAFLRPFDMHFSIRTEQHYFVASGPEDLEVSGPGKSGEALRVRTTSDPYYRVFVEDVLERVRHDSPPVAGLDDMTAVMELVDRAYALARTSR